MARCTTTMALRRKQLSNASAALKSRCEHHGVPLAAAALQFPLAHPQVASVIPGLGSRQQVERTLSLYRKSIPDALLAGAEERGPAARRRTHSVITTGRSLQHGIRHDGTIGGKNRDSHGRGTRNRARYGGTVRRGRRDGVATDIIWHCLATCRVAGPASLTSGIPTRWPLLLREAGPIDVLFNCAGYVHSGTILECDRAHGAFSLDINVTSMYRLIRAALPGMLERSRGSIINMSSVADPSKGFRIDSFTA